MFDELSTRERYFGDHNEVCLDRMVWDFVYQQSTGDFGLGYARVLTDEFTCVIVNVLCRGYAGRGVGWNNPARQEIVGEGPLPRGIWSFQKGRYHKELGPQSIPVIPDRETKTFGRSGFYIHGDNKRGDNSASRGCIILPREIRDFVDYMAQRPAKIIRLHVVS